MPGTIDCVTGYFISEAGKVAGALLPKNPESLGRPLMKFTAWSSSLKESHSEPERRAQSIARIDRVTANFFDCTSRCTRAAVHKAHILERHRAAGTCA